MSPQTIRKLQCVGLVLPKDKNAQILFFQKTKLSL